MSKIQIISDKMNSNPKIQMDKKRVRPHKSEVQKLQCDNSELIKLTNWKQRYTFLKGINNTIKSNEF